MDITTRIRKFLSRAIPGEISDDDDIFELGMVDSLFAMQLLVFIEREFGITAERCDLDIKNFSSIGAVRNFVMSKRGLAAY
jgi:acyl carrier protein